MKVKGCKCALLDLTSVVCGFSLLSRNSLHPLEQEKNNAEILSDRLAVKIKEAKGVDCTEMSKVKW